MTKPNFVILDIETTGLDHNTDHIIQVGAIRITHEFKFIDQFSTLVSLPKDVELSEFIKNYTGINDEDLKGKPTAKMVVDQLKQFVYNNENKLEPVIVAHNAPFDFAFLSRLGYTPREFICTRTLSKIVDPNEKAGLEDICRRFGFYNAEGHHEAVSDCKMTANVLYKLLPVAKRRGENYRNVVLDHPERPLRFLPAYSKKVVIV